MLISAPLELHEHEADVLDHNIIVHTCLLTMDYMQGRLFAAIKRREGDFAKQILLEDPEMTYQLANAKRTGDFEHEVTTPLIEACKYGRWYHCYYKLLKLNKGNVHTFSTF